MRDLKSVLADAGVDVSTFSWLRASPDEIAGLTVPGAQAVALWESLRALVPATGHYPVIVGPDNDRNRTMADHRWNRGGTEDLVRLTREPFDLAAFARDRCREVLEWSRQEWPQDVPRMERCLRYLDGAEPLRWPEVEPDNTVWIPIDLLKRRPHPRVHVALVPTDVPWLAPVYVRFGGFNECPDCSRHAAVLRAWGEEFGAEPVGMSHDMLDVRVARPPADRRRAVRLAVEQWAYDADVWGDAVRSEEELAAWLSRARVWTFWWD